MTEPVPQPHGGALTPFQPGQSGNPAGRPKGARHISTWIQEMMEDEDFNIYLQHPTKGFVEYKGAPVKAIVQTAIRKAAAGDDKARDWLAKYGYRQQLDITTAGKKLPAPIYGGMSGTDIPVQGHLSDSQDIQAE